MALQQALEALVPPTAAPTAAQSVAAVAIGLAVGSVLKHASVWSLDALARGNVPVRRVLANAACTAAWVGYLPAISAAMDTADTHPHKLYEHIGSMLAAVAWVAARPRAEGRSFEEQAWLLIALSAHALPTMHQWVRYGIAVGMGGRAKGKDKPEEPLSPLSMLDSELF